MAQSGSIFPDKETKEEQGTLQTASLPQINDSFKKFTLTGLLAKLPRVILNDIIYTLLNIKEQTPLIPTNKFFGNFFTHPHTPRQCFFNKLLVFLEDGNKGNKDTVMAALQKDPSLYDTRGTLVISELPWVNPNEKTLTGSLYQMAIYRCNYTIAAAIQDNLSYLPNGIDKIREQLNEIFPEGYLEAKTQNFAENMKALNAIAKAIDESKADTYEELEKACQTDMYTFHDYLRSSQKKSRNHFAIHLFLQAMELSQDPDRQAALKYNIDHPKAQYFIWNVPSIISVFVPPVYRSMFSFQRVLNGEVRHLPLLKRETAQIDEALAGLIYTGEKFIPTHPGLRAGKT